MLDENCTPENFKAVRKGELDLFKTVRKLTIEPDSEHLAGKLISATTDLKAWQFHYFGHTDLQTPITSRIHEFALAFLIAAQAHEGTPDEAEV